MRRHYVVVVGGGHKSLTAAAYLARAGLRVLVLERLVPVGSAPISQASSPLVMFSSLQRPPGDRETCAISSIGRAADS